VKQTAGLITYKLPLTQGLQFVIVELYSINEIMSSDNNYHLISKTIGIALRSNLNFKLGAIIVKHNKIISTGYNQLRHQSSLKTTHWSGSLHAEVACILNALRVTSTKTIQGSTMFVVRVRKSGKLGLAMPCADCYSVIENVGIKRVMFSTDSGYSEIKVGDEYR